MKKSKSELLLEDILNKIESIDIHHINLFNKTADGVNPKLIQKEIEQLIMQLYDASIIDNFYYLDCPLEVYINTYDRRLKEVRETDKGLSEVFFLKSELEDLIEPEYKFSKTDLSEFRKYCLNTFYNSSFNSKIEFIRNKLLALGHIVNITPETYQIPEYTNYRSYSRISVDYKYDPYFIKKDEINTYENQEKLEWIGNDSHLGFILGTLVEKGFIKAPKHKSGDINYSKLAKFVKQSFISNTKESSLSKYLSLDSEKSQETKRALEEYGFSIPDIIEVTKSVGKKRSSNN